MYDLYTFFFFFFSFFVSEYKVLLNFTRTERDFRLEVEVAWDLLSDYPGYLLSVDIIVVECQLLKLFEITIDLRGLVRWRVISGKIVLIVVFFFDKLLSILVIF